MELSKITIDNFEENINKYDENIKKVSPFLKLDFVTKTAEIIDSSFLIELNKNINRLDSANKLIPFVKDINIAFKIEAGVYEFSLVYVFVKNMSKSMLVPIYNDKFNELLENLNIKSRLKNEFIIKAIIDGTICPQNLAFMSPQELHPKNWDKEIKKKKLTEYKKEHMASTDAYQCYKCKERKCILYQMQTRSADEPLTNFVTCLVCYNTFKVE